MFAYLFIFVLAETMYMTMCTSNHQFAMYTTHTLVYIHPGRCVHLCWGQRL